MRASLSLSLILTAGFLLLPRAGAGEGGVPAPMVLAEQGAFLLAIIPDLSATLTRAEQIAELFNPGKIKAGAFKAQLGAVLGDPGLANFTGKPLMVVVGPGSPLPSFALVLPAKNVQAYLDAAASKGLIMGVAVGDLAVVAQNPDGQALGESIARAYPDLLKAPISGDLRLVVAPDRAVAAYGGFLGGLVGMAAMRAAKQPGQELLGKILPLEFAALMAVLGDVAGVQADFNLANGMITEDVAIAAKPGSNLAKALVAPPKAGTARAAARMGDQPGLVQVSGRTNFPAFLAFAADLLSALQARPEAKEMITPALIDTIRSWPLPFSGDWAMRLRTTDQAPLLTESVIGCTDPAKTEQAFDQAMALFTGDGPLAKLYQNFGLKLAVTKKARSVAGVAVHRMSSTLDESRLNADQVAMMKAVIRDNEIAITPEWMLGAQDAKTLDQLIAGSGPAMIVKAERSIGPGRDTYVDIDVIRFIAMELRVIGDKVPDFVSQVFAKIAPGEPIAAAFTIADGRARIEYRVPLTPFAEIAKGFRQLQNPQQPPSDNPGKDF